MSRSRARRLSTTGRPRGGRAGARSRNALVPALGIAAIIGCLLVLFLAVRGVAGCVSRAFAPKDEAPAQQQETESQASAPAAKESPVQIDLVMIGDILQHRGVFESGYMDDGTRNYDHIFANIAGLIDGADIKVVNQETVLGGAQFDFSGYPSFNGPQEMGDAEVKAGFNVILRATNHAMDMGYAGLSSEISFWHTNHPEVGVIGAVDPNDPETSVDDVYVFEKDGFKVALLNYTYDLNGYEDPQGAVSMLDEEHVKRTLATANELADMVVVFPHWGEEYNLTPVQSQYDMANTLIENGADVIIGGHPHVIEPVEVLTASDGRKVPCFWSVGNFVSTQLDSENLVGGAAKVTLYKDSDGSCRVTAASFVPTITHEGVGVNLTTYPIYDYTDALASSSYDSNNGVDHSTLTREWANEFCTQVLGSGFDTASGVLTIDPASLEPTQAQSGDSTGQQGLTVVDGDGANAEELDDAA